MFKRTKILATITTVLAATQAFACFTPLPWRFSAPVDSPKQYHMSNIGASGDASVRSSTGFTLEVKDGNNTLQSQGGTASDCAWSATIPEPSGGWNNQGLYMDVNLELWSGGNNYDTVVIAVK